MHELWAETAGMDCADVSQRRAVTQRPSSQAFNVDIFASPVPSPRAPLLSHVPYFFQLILGKHNVQEEVTNAQLQVSGPWRRLANAGSGRA